MGLLVGTRKGLFTFEQHGAEWSIADVAFLGEPVTAVVVDAVGTAYAALGTGHFGAHLWRKPLGGQWSETTAPAYPPRPADATDVSEMTQQPWKWSLDTMWTLETGHPDRPGELWCGTIPGGLFHSPDGGETWSLNDPLWHMPERSMWAGGGFDWPGVHSISVDPRDPDTMLVAVSCGGSWYSTDAGATWTVSTGMRNSYMPEGMEYDPVAQDPHRVVRCAAQPDVMWNQHHNGCFRSTDGGRTWTEITERAPSVFGFAVAAHPTDPETAWFAPAIKDESRVAVGGRMVVSRTSDGGKTFDVLSDGLPQEHAYHLVYRHGLDVDSTGTKLAMGSTTGSLWMSHNSGDRWERFSADLPPIYVVRFTEFDR